MTLTEIENREHVYDVHVTRCTVCILKRECNTAESMLASYLDAEMQYMEEMNLEDG
jgi:hypothetical protein